MDLNNFGVINSIVAILNSAEAGPNRAIASYLATHLSSLGDVTAQSVMDEAFVSRSAVRRFCNALGYRSWSELKASVDPNVFPSDLRHRDTALPASRYRELLDDEVAAIVRDQRRHVKDDEVRALALLVHEAEPVTFVCPSNTLAVLSRFQQELLYAGKSTGIVSSAYAERIPPARAEGSLVAVVSVTGTFAAKVAGLARAWAAESALVTANAACAGGAGGTGGGGAGAWQGASSAFDRVFLMSGERRQSDVLGAFAKYGAAYYFDLLSAFYLHEFASAS